MNDDGIGNNHHLEMYNLEIGRTKMRDGIMIGGINRRMIEKCRVVREAEVGHAEEVLEAVLEEEKGE